MEQENKDLKMCRICLQIFDNNNFRSLNDKFKSLPLYEHINSLSTLPIAKEDGLPDKICLPCLKELKTCISFKIKCESSNKILMNNIKSYIVKTNDIAVKLETEYDDYNYIEDNETWTDMVQTRLPTVKDETVEISNTKEQPQCHDCGELFPSKCKLRVHWKRVHKPTTFLCPICKRVFKSPQAYNKHIRNTPSSCSDLYKIGIHVVGEGPSRIFSCSQCDYKSKRVIHTKAHMVTHTKEKLFRCEICGKAYTQAGSLKNHLEGEHFEESSLKGCHICGKTFRGNSRLYKHIAIHNTESYECEICKKPMKGKKSLKIHMSRHSGVKGYTCELCAASFFTSAELCNHRRVHTGNFCAKAKLYKCDLCDYSTTKYRLKKHMQKHIAGDKPYFCNQCGNFFLTLQKLATHERLHFETKKFSCPLCNKMFFCRRSVSKHVISKHNSKMLQNRGKIVTIKQEIPPMVH